MADDPRTSDIDGKPTNHPTIREKLPTATKRGNRYS